MTSPSENAPQASPLLKSFAICLNVRPFSKTSQMVTWLTLDHGRVTTPVKGAQRPKSAFIGRYDVGYTCELVFYARERNGVHHIRECACAPHEATLALLWFESNLLRAVGLGPDFSPCPRCAPSPRGLFSVEEGRFVCEHRPSRLRTPPTLTLHDDIPALYHRFLAHPLTETPPRALPRRFRSAPFPRRLPRRTPRPAPRPPPDDPGPPHWLRAAEPPWRTENGEQRTERATSARRVKFRENRQTSFFREDANTREARWLTPVALRARCPLIAPSHPSSSRLDRPLSVFSTGKWGTEGRTDVRPALVPHLSCKTCVFAVYFFFKHYGLRPQRSSLTK